MKSLEKVVKDYFTCMFATNENISFSEVLGCVPRRVTPEMNQSLVANYSDKEIREVSFLFLRALFQECGYLKQILGLYERVSIQCINFQKCAISLSINIRREVHDQLTAFIGVTRVDGHD